MSRFTQIWRPRAMVFIFLQMVDQQRNFRAVKCKLRKQAPNLLEEAPLFDSMEDVVKHFGKSAAYHLHVTGSGVLSRKIESLPNYMDELIINGNPDEFQFSTYDDGSQMAASFFRKALISDELDLVAAQKLHLLGISAGLAPLFLLGEDVRVFLDFSVVKQKGKIVDFQRLEKPSENTVFEGSSVKLEQLLSSSMIGFYLQNQAEYSCSDAERFALADVNYRQFNQFRKSGVTVVSVILFTLIANYFYVNRLKSNIAQLELDLSASNESLSLLERLEEEKRRKEQLVLSAGVNSPRFLAFYLDEIGKTVPEQINLQEMQVFPVDGKLKNKQKVEVVKDAIRISGSTLGNEVLDNWIELMDRFEWIQGIELMNYLKTEGERSDFLLMITLAQ